MKYILFEASAAEKLITNVFLQSIEYQLGQDFINFLRGTQQTFQCDGIATISTNNGVIFSGGRVEKKILLIDLEQCLILEKTSDTDLLLIIQKMLRFAIRYWGQQSFTSAENIVDDKAVIFPFPHSAKNEHRIVIAREPDCPRLKKREISFSLLAYKYSDRGAPKGGEQPNTTVYQKAGEAYLNNRSEIVEKLKSISLPESKTRISEPALQLVEVDSSLNNNVGFKYRPIQQQISGLTETQKKVVNSPITGAPIRVEGPAGTGKTLSLIIRAVILLQHARSASQNLKIAFFAHSRTTEDSIRLIFDSITEGQWSNNEQQSITFITLQQFCAEYIHLNEIQIIDGDAYEAKQYQLLLIQDIFEKATEKYYKTYRPHLSTELRDFLDQEDNAKIVTMLQHEFSVQIKGYSGEDFEIYKGLPALDNGLPAQSENDKTYVFRLFTSYQDYLQRESVFDTDDVVLEAISRLRGPLWKRERVQRGYDYILVDEMHLFNVNEQQIYHFLTKNTEQESIPICFALDYSQAIGDRGDILNGYIEKALAKDSIISQEYSTVFRSSQEITELCASITASGATLFNRFINPYKTVKSGFTSREESLSAHPTLFMYPDEKSMLSSVKIHVDSMMKTFQCDPSQIAVIVFGENKLNSKAWSRLIGRAIIELISRNSFNSSTKKRGGVIFSTPENINGLEFDGVILVGVDEGRVPVTSANDISENFMRFRALNQLYLACSRAKYQIRILGNASRGLSSCLDYSLNNGTLLLEEINDVDKYS